jgi:hypothetical protein
MGALAALGLLAGCGRTVAEPVTLSDLQGRSLQFALTDIDSLERDSSVGAYRFTLAFSNESCAKLASSVTATLNGQPMKLAPGGVPDTGVGGREVCEPPSATFDFDPAQWDAEPTEDLRVILQDDTQSVLLVLQEAKAKRRFLRTSAGTAGTLRRGQTHTYAWLPETDTLAAPVQATLIHKASGAVAALTVQQEGNAAHFLVPAGTVEGQYILRLSGTASPAVLSCEGVAGCTGALFHSEDLEVSITN